MIPTGREFGQSILTHHFWTQMQECGACALWFGNTRGGVPALVNGVVGSMLHPLVAITALGWGVLNGSKLALIGAFFMSGVAQWWLARVLGTGTLAALWSGAVAVAGGHMASRMDLGSFSLTISMAASAMVYPPLFLLLRNGTRRAAVMLGIAIALAGVSGNGYMQVGLAFTLPVVLIGLIGPRDRAWLMMVRFAQAAVLALLLASPMLVPFARFSAQFAKDVDPTFRSAQPLAYLPLNFVIADHRFFTTDALSKLPFPFFYANFVGWVPVLLAACGLGGRRGSVAPGRTELLLGMLIVTALWVASAAPLAWLAQHAPSRALRETMVGVRAAPLIAGLAVPPLLALAALGLDRVLRLRLTRSRVQALTGARLPRWLAISPVVLLLPPLTLALQDARVFGARWIGVTPFSVEVPEVILALQADRLRWVGTPLGEHFFLEQAVAARLKLSDDFLTWHWRDRKFPEPTVQASRGAQPQGMTAERAIGGVVLSSAPLQEYAVVERAGARTVCDGRGTGGNIDVSCDATQGGILTVKEHRWDGWEATVDGQPVPLRPGQWLSLELPPAGRSVSLRYRPWDVPVGLAMGAVGVILAFLWWRQPRSYRTGGLYTRASESRAPGRGSGSSTTLPPGNV